MARIIVVNKLERENTNFAKVLEDLQSRFGAKVIRCSFRLAAKINLRQSWT